MKLFSTKGSIQRGIVTGITLSLLVSVGVFSAVNLAGAQAGDSVWTDEGTSASSSTTKKSGTVPKAPGTTTSTTTRTTTPKQTDAYVGLGDSVAAGLGLPTWIDATSQDISCGRSPASYVFEVGRQLDRPHAPYACSGATSASLPRQLDQTFAQGVPAVMSITIGANDIRWSSVVQQCYTGTCGTSSQTTTIENQLVTLQKNLIKAMDQIESRSGNNTPTVVLTGYYNPVSTLCSAATQQRLSPAEITWISGSVDALNQTIQSVADSYTFARFASLDNFKGHDACSDMPWVQGLQDEAPLHPTAVGQQGISQAVMRVLNDQKL